MSDSRLEIVLAAQDLASKTINSFQGNLERMTKSVFSLQGAIGAFAGGYGLQQLATSFLDTARSFERFETQLTTITGSSKIAKESMGWISDFAKKTPYELGQVTDAFVKLKAYGLDATKYLGTLGDTASSMGKGLDQAVEMFADAVTGEFERLKEFGVRAVQQGDQVAFKWSENGKDMVVTAQKTQSGISTALGQVLSRFEGGMARQAETFDGIWSNLLDNITDLERKIMDAGVFDEIKTQVAGINEELVLWVKNNEDLIRQKIPEYVANVKEMAAATVSFIGGMKSGWDAMPDIIKDIGIAGALWYGKKGLLVLGAAIHMAEWAKNFHAAMKLAAAGTVNFSEVATANFGELKALVEKHSGATKTLTYAINEQTEGWELYSKGAEKAGGAVETTTKSLTDMYAAIEGGNEITAKNLTWFDDIDETSKKLREKLKADALKAEKDLATSTGRMLEVSYLASLDAVSRGIEEVNRQFIDLVMNVEELYDAGAIGADERSGLIAGLNANWDKAISDVSKKDVSEYDKAQEKKLQINEHFLERVQDASADFLVDLKDKGIDSFGDMMDRIGDLIYRYFAEWAAYALANPIVLPIVQSATTGLFGGVTGGTTAGGGSNGLTTRAGSYLWNNYGTSTGLGQYVAGAMQYDLLPSAATSYDALTGLPTSNIGGSSLGAGFTLGDALGYFGLGSLGYSTVGDWIGLPQSKYSGMAAGAGAALGGYGGAALGSSTLLAGATYGSYLGPIGAVVGAILGGLLGSVFGGQESKKYVDLKNMPNMDTSWGYGQTPMWASFDEDLWKTGINNVGYDNLNDYDKGLSDMMYATVMDGLAPLVQGVYSTVDDMLAQMPEDLAADIKADLVGMGDVFSLEGISKHILRNRSAERAELDIERILTEASDMMLEHIVPVFENNVSTYLQGMIENASGTLSMLDSNHMLSKFIGNRAIFNEDFSRAEGASFENYGQQATEFLNVVGQIQGAWDAVSIGFERMITPLTQEAAAIENVTNQVNQAISVLEQLGFSEEALTEAREKGLAVIDAERQRQRMEEQRRATAAAVDTALGQQSDAKGIHDFLTDAIQTMTMDPIQKATLDAQKEWYDLTTQILALPKEYHYLLDLSAEWLGLTIKGINEVEDVAKNFVDNMRTARTEAAGWYNAGLPVISQIESDIEYRASGLSREDFLKMKINAFDQQYKSGDMTLADWENYTGMVASWWVEATRESEATAQAWKDAADIAKDLAKAIKDTKESLLMGALNVQLPSAKFATASGIYQEKLFAAKTGGASEIQDYLSFASEYLTAAQENFKSSDTYQQLFQSVMSEMDALTAIVESDNFTQKLFEEAKRQTAVLGSIDAGVAALAQSYTNSIQVVIDQKTQQSGFDLTAVDDIMSRYPGFTPDYAHATQYGDWLANANVTDSEAQRIAKASNVSVNQVISDARTMAAYYDYVEAQRKSGIAVPYTPGFADGGISYGPTSGYPAMLHGTELIVPLDGSGRPGQVRNNDSGRPINVVVEVGGEEFAAYIDRRADNVRVKATRRNMGSNRIMN